MINKKIFIISLLIFLPQTLFPQEKSLPELVTVDKVDLKKYVGLWYEVAKIPNSFQDQCIYGTTAEYKIDEDGDIIVTNSCYDDEGKLDVAEGLAKVVDKNTNAKLEVSFVSFLGIRPFWGDYWIIGLDENYQWAVVGTPGRKYGWLLSRTPSLPDSTMQTIFEILKSQHYNPDDFEISEQKK
jgi:apolipoprotein D and lipocalin family protein